MNHAFKGFKIEAEKAIQLLKSKNDESLTQLEKDQRDRIISATRNLIDFAVCEEYQLYAKIKDMVGDGDVDFNSDEYDSYEEMCEIYNKKYSEVENSDVEYCMGIASWWILMDENCYLTYMTQNDDRVRPWHMALQGFTARKNDFPAWMIPPIEWACRCFLLSDNGDVFSGADELKKVVAKVPKRPEQIDGIFKESVAKCGRIFSDEHPYFNIRKEDVNMLSSFVERLKEKWSIN